ncbi:kinase-like domain-containing protein [Mycena pura]|uniref:cAMP-dependent protein kinase n=1 Tax=Mycena pura TaxID=153505 RepID=A0AAD6Y493_9AGAR|nr:kinase-like domain-containing protein [Mycena pura]
MIRRMADKLGHLGHSSHPRGDDTDALHAALSSPTSTQSTVSSYLSSYDHRGSISTQATTTSEWSNDKRYESDMEVVVEEHRPVSRPRLVPVREKGVYRLNDFIIQRTLGTGSFGRVHLVRSKHNMRFYAIKVLNKDRVVKLKQVEHTNNEQRMLECVQHAFIVNLWGSFQDTANLYMVMDFVPGGELFTLLRRSNRFPDPVAKFYAAEVGLALNHLHGLGIIYRDLKPENVLLNSDGHIKVADFGFAKAVDTTTWTLCGTPDYLAPEIIGQQRYNKSVDWYALGILMYEMLFGLPPYHMAEQNHMVLYDRIRAGPSKVAFPSAAFSEHAKDLIMKLMESDPSKRYGNMRHGAGDVFAHQWFREVDWQRLERREITAPYLPRIAGDGDASAFDRYPEDDVSATYGMTGPDLNGHLFPDFDYTAR